MKRRGRFLALGDSILDFVSVSAHESERNYVAYGGGAIANVCRHLTEAGHPVEFITAFSPDPFGQQLKSQFIKLGVGLSYAKTIASTETPLCFISNASDGERFFLHRGGDPYGVFDLPADEVSTDNFDYFVWGISALRTAESRFLVDRISEYEHLLRVCDPGTCPSWWGNPEALKVYLFERMHSIDVLKCSMPEARWLTGSDDPEEALAYLAKAGAKMCVITLGDNGLVYQREEENGPRKIVVEKVNAVDTTGAGDATLAGLLDYLARNPDTLDSETVANALEAGAKWGRHTVTFQGAGPWRLDG